MRSLCVVLMLGLGFAWAQLEVVTSIHPYYALVQEIAGEDAVVTRLLPPGASPHTFDPSPQDVARVAGANLVVLNGGLDAWLSDLVRTSGGGTEVLELLDELDFDALEDAHAEEAEGGAEEHEGVNTDAHDEDHGAGGVNPHVWLDPVIMTQAVTLIGERLAVLDPDKAAGYRARANDLAARLRELDAELRAQLEPVRDEPFVPFHDAWPYFARRYSLDLLLEIEPSPGREPSARYIVEALQLIAASGAKAIFSELQLPQRPAEVVAENAGLPLYLLDPIGGVEGRLTYAELLRYNAAIIAGALAD